MLESLAMFPLSKVGDHHNLLLLNFCPMGFPCPNKPCWERWRPGTTFAHFKVGTSTTVKQSNHIFNLVFEQTPEKIGKSN